LAPTLISINAGWAILGLLSLQLIEEGALTYIPTYSCDSVFTYWKAKFGKQNDVYVCNKL